eukprot:4522776-Pyramimonas_sp.AAC.1
MAPTWRWGPNTMSPSPQSFSPLALQFESYLRPPLPPHPPKHSRHVCSNLTLGPSSAHHRSSCPQRFSGRAHLSRFAGDLCQRRSSEFRTEPELTSTTLLLRAAARSHMTDDCDMVGDSPSKG